MAHLYKIAKICDCGYTTFNRGNWSIHHKHHCKLRHGSEERENEHLKNQVARLEQQLAVKDEQIRELIQVAKKPRTVNHTTTTNNRYVVEQHINVFGKESLEHIRPEQIEALLADPANAVSRFIKLKHQKAPGDVNANVRVPNQKRAIYQVVVAAEGEEKEWENRAKGEVLEQMYDENSGHLEAEADEETRVGSQFLEHQDLVKASAAADAADGGRRYKEQLDKIHMVLAN
jgi:hypothetical protein